MVVTAEEYLAAQRHELTLPSGFVVVVRKVDVATLIASGGLPADLVSLTEPNKDAGELDPETVQHYAQAMAALVEGALVEPKLSASDLDPDDRDAIFAWAMESTGLTEESVRPFRGVGEE